MFVENDFPESRQLKQISNNTTNNFERNFSDRMWFCLLLPIIIAKKALQKHVVYLLMFEKWVKYNKEQAEQFV